LEIARNLFCFGQCHFELCQDNEAIVKFKALDGFSRAQPATLSGEVREELDDMMESSKTYLSIMEQLPDLSKGSFGPTLKTLCRLEGPESCHQHFRQTIANSLTIANTEWLKKRALAICMKYFDAFDAAHSDSDLDCPSDNDQFWHRLNCHLERSKVLRNMLDHTGATITMFRCLQLYKEHSKKEILVISHRTLRNWLHDLALFMGDMDSMSHFSDWAFTARVACHFAFFVAKSSRRSLATRMCLLRVISSHRALWKQPAAISARSEAADNPDFDMELVSEIQLDYFDIEEMKEIYRTSDALLFPEAWDAASKQYFPCQERRLSPRSAEWP
jgi:hypothetical protein